MLEAPSKQAKDHSKGLAIVLRHVASTVAMPQLHHRKVAEERHGVVGYDSSFSPGDRN